MVKIYNKLVEFSVNDFQYCDLVNLRRKFFIVRVHKTFLDKLIIKKHNSDTVIPDNYEPIQFDEIRFVSKHMTLTGYNCTFQISEIKILQDKTVLRSCNDEINSLRIAYKLGDLISYTEKTDFIRIN